MHLNKAKQFLSDAICLMENKRFDSSVSRCYYCLYRFGIYLLEREGHQRPGWSHYGVQKKVRETGLSF